MNIKNRQDKKVLEFNKEVDSGRLMNELYEAVSELKPVINDSGFEAKMRVFTNGNELILWVPEEIEEARITAVVEAHRVIILMEEGEA